MMIKLTKIELDSLQRILLVENLPETSDHSETHLYDSVNKVTRSGITSERQFGDDENFKFRAVRCCTIRAKPERPF